MATKEEKIKAIIAGQAKEFQDKGYFVDGSDNLAIRTHIGLGFDWWIFPCYTKTEDKKIYHVDRATEEGKAIYKALRENDNYSKNYLDSIDRYISAFTEGGTKHEISYPIRFLKLIQSLIGITENNTQLIQGLDKEKQDALFEKVYNFLKEKNFHKASINEHYLEDCQELNGIIDEINKRKKDGKSIEKVEFSKSEKSKKPDPKSDPKLATVIDFGDDSDKDRFIVASSFYTEKKPQQDFFKDRGVDLKDDDSLFYCLTGTYTTEDAGGSGLMGWFRGFTTDKQHSAYVAEIKKQKAKIKKADGSSQVFTGSTAKANSADAKSKIFQFNHLIQSQDPKKGSFIYGISPDFGSDFKGLDAKSVMRKWGYHFRENIEKLLEEDPAKVKIVIPGFSCGVYAGEYAGGEHKENRTDELRQGMLEGLFLYERENPTCKKFTFLLSSFHENEIKQARENVYSSDNPLKKENIKSITSEEAKYWDSIEEIKTKQAKKAEKSSEKKPKTVEKDEMLNYALRAYLLDYKGDNSQEYFNNQFNLDSDKPTSSDPSNPNKITREQYQEYLNKKLTQADSGVDKKTQYLQSFESKTIQSNKRQIHSGLHAFLTAQYAEACLNLYKQYKSHFPKKIQNQIEQFDNDSNKLEELKFLVAMHDIARTQDGSDKDEHKNAFYVALILQQKFNKTTEEAIELALNVACKSSGYSKEAKENKTLFSRLIQSADSIAYSRVGGGTDFDRERCNICKDFSYFFKHSSDTKKQKPQIFESFEKSFTEFTKKTESLERALTAKDEYSKEIEVGQEPKKGYESFFTKSDQDKAIKTNYEEIVQMSSDFSTKEIETFSFKSSSLISENDKQKKEFFRLMYLDERMHSHSGGVTTQDFEKLSRGEGTKQQDSAEIVEKVLGAFALNKNKYVIKYSPKNEDLESQYKGKEAKEDDTLLIQISSNYITKIYEVFNEEGINETVKDVAFEKHSSSDEEKIEATQNSKCKITGDEFCVQLKRFHSNSDKTPTKIDTEFNNRKLSIKKEGDEEKKDYLPTAFIVHSGGASANYGHYVCYVKCSDDKWYCIDDGRAYQVKEEDISDEGFPYQLKQAYIVKYSNKQASLPDKELFQQGYTNHGNHCYANASLNFLKSLTSTLPRELVFKTTKKEESKSKGDASKGKGKEGSESYDDDDSETKPESKKSGTKKSADSKEDNQEHQDDRGSSPTDEDQKMMAILKKRPFTIEERLEKHNKKFGSVLQKPKTKFDLKYDESTEQFTLSDPNGLTKTINKKEVDKFKEDIKTKGEFWQEINKKYQEFHRLRRQEGKSKEEAEQATKLPGKYIKILQVINLANQGKFTTKSS